jgi:hypothetical protein
MADQIRAALDDAVEDFQVEGFMLLSPTPPAIDIYLANPSRGSGAAGFEDLDGEYIVEIRARVSANDHEANQGLLYDLCDDESPYSIQAALQADPTLGGLASSVHVSSVSGHVVIPSIDGASVHLGVLWTVQVIQVPG